VAPVFSLAEEFKQSPLIVTHENYFAQCTHRIIEMEAGSVISDKADAREGKF